MTDMNFPTLNKRNGKRSQVTLEQEADQFEKEHPVTETEKTEEDVRRPRIVLTEGAIFHESAVDGHNREEHGGWDHRMCGVGDVVNLTDAEFDAHRAGGVCLVNQDEHEQQRAA
jgi:hypothetical protein